MPAGSRPGERRGGRGKGVPNKITTEIRTEARKYTKKAIKLLADAVNDTELAMRDRIRSACYLLDQAYGKPSQVLDHKGDGLRSVVPVVNLTMASAAVTVLEHEELPPALEASPIHGNGSCPAGDRKLL